MNSPALALQCSGLTLKNHETGLAPLNLELPANTLTCIVGPCDSGKTAYSRLLGGVDPPAAGSLRILDKNVWHISKSEWQTLRQNAGYVLPNSALLSALSVLRNVTLPAQYHYGTAAEKLDERADEILTWLGFSADSGQLPGYLSEYQQRLTTLARCLILNPKMLFIDEAFAFLDASARKNIAQRYLDMQNELNMTLVLATHNLAFASEHADVLVFMHPEGPKIYHQWEDVQADQDPYIQMFIHANFDNYLPESC